MTNDIDNDDCPVDVPAVDPGVAKVAAKASKSVGRLRDLIDSVTNELGKPELFNRIRAFQLIPDYDQLIVDERIADVLPEIMQIADTYLNGEINIGQIDQDILRLAAHLIYFGGKVNQIEGVALDAETTHKQAYERALLHTRSLIDDAGGKATKEVAEAIASVSVEDRRHNYVAARTLSQTMKGTYFAAKDLLEVMNSASARLYRERNFPGNT